MSNVESDVAFSKKESRIQNPEFRMVQTLKTMAFMHPWARHERMRDCDNGRVGENAIMDAVLSAISSIQQL